MSCLPAEVEITALNRDHIPQMLELWEQAGLETKLAGRDHPDALRHEMETFPHNFIGAFAKGRLVGVANASWDGRRGWINRIAVLKDFRRQGLAQRLISCAETDLKARGARVIAVLIDPSNSHSLSLFKKSGYANTPQAVYLSKRDGPDV